MRRLILVPAFVVACLAVPALGDDGLRMVALTAARVTAALGFTPLAPSNNLSDVAAPATARTNLGLGTAATQNTGASGAVVPLLNGANTWAAVQSFSGDAYLSNPAGGGLWMGTATGAPGTAGDKIILYGSFGTRAVNNYSLGVNGGEMIANVGAASAAFNVYAAGTRAGGISLVNGVSAAKLSTTPTTAPSAGFGALFFVAGTNAGTCKLQTMAGTSTTPVTIADNIGSGC